MRSVDDIQPTVDDIHAEGVMIYKAYALIFDRPRSKMCSANEVTFVDAMHGTNLNARATAGAEVVVDACEVILNGNCALRTGLLALHTTDTAVGAVLTGECALILVRALNDNTGGVVDEVDDAVGALTHADAAADTLLGVNSGNAVLNLDSVLRTYRNAVAVAEAGVGAESVTAIGHIGGTAGLLALVVVLSFNDVAGTVAGNVSNLLNNLSSFNAENCGDTLSGVVTAGDTEVGLIGGLLSKSLCVAVTSRVSTGATVSARETVTDSNGGLVLLNAEEDVCEGEDNRTDCAYTKKK